MDGEGARKRKKEGWIYWFAVHCEKHNYLGYHSVTWSLLMCVCKCSIPYLHIWFGWCVGAVSPSWTSARSCPGAVPGPVAQADWGLSLQCPLQQAPRSGHYESCSPSHVGSVIEIKSENSIVLHNEEYFNRRAPGKTSLSFSVVPSLPCPGTTPCFYMTLCLWPSLTTAVISQSSGPLTLLECETVEGKK